MAEITKEEIASAIVNDKVILADTVRVKSENGMWAKPLQEQTALVNLETNIIGGASSDVDTFAEVENEIKNRYTKAEVDDKTDMTRLRTHILPENANTDLGSPTKRFRGIYVDEAYLSTNTLYIGDTPVMGTDADTIVIKADLDQSVLIKTTGTGTTGIQSEDEVQINTTGTNADVKVQATGLNSKVRLAGSGGIELSSPTTVQNDLTVSGNVTFSGNVTANGSQFLVNATTVTTKDNIILLNQGELGSGVTSGKSGIQVDRGDFADYQLIFDETTDKFVVGSIGGTYETLATREYVATEFTNYTIPTASSTTLGGIKIGAGLTITNGVVSVNDGGTADSVEWTGVLNKPTTISGYGITDSYTKAEVESKIVELSPPTDISMKANTTDVNTALATKVDKVVGKGLSTEDYTTVEKTKLASIANGAQVNVPTDLSLGTITTSTIPLNSSTGTDVTLPAVTTTTAGLMISTDKTKLDGIATGANNYTLPTATSTVKGGVELYSDTVQTVASNEVTTTASRTYGIQLNSAGQAVVNVPWSDTNTIYTHPTTDGNLHVPATGTTNNGKVLMAGATAGSLSWSTIPNASTSLNGLMSSADKVKLDGLSNYSKPASEPISYITGLQTALDDKATIGALNTEKGRIDAILASAGASTDTFAEIVSLINSVDTTNDTAFAGYVTSNDSRSTTIEANITTLTNNKVDKTGSQALHATDALRVSGTTVSLYKGDGTFESITTQDTIYTHPNSGVTAGTYKSVTVNAAGHVTGGTNPTTLAGYGITDATPSSHVGSTGTAHGNATTTVAGFMSSTDKSKLDGIATGAQVNVPTDLSLGTATGTTLPLNSSTGTDVVLPAVTTSAAGLMSAADKTKLDSIANSANNYSLPVASSAVYGGIKVSATAQTVAANAVTTTASRTYAVQLDASGNALVNVPWVDNNTVYTHPTSGVTAGTYKSVTVDANGHITAGTNPTTLAGYGITDAATSNHTHTGTYEPVINAGNTTQYLRGDKTWQSLPTSLPASDVYAWAKSVNKPTYTAAEVGALSTSGGTMTGAITAIRETRVNMAANNIDLTAGNLFTKTISTATTFTVSGALASGNANSFMLELTNAGAYTITWWAGVKWPGGVAPTLTASGVDILGFYSHDGGVTWRGFVSKDSK